MFQRGMIKYRICQIALTSYFICTLSYIAINEYDIYNERIAERVYMKDMLYYKQKIIKYNEKIRQYPNDKSLEKPIEPEKFKYKKLRWW